MDSYSWWNDTQKKLAKEAQEVVDELMPISMESALKKEYPWKVVEEIGKRGWYGALIPKKYGGRWEDWGSVGSCIITEETARLPSFLWNYSLNTAQGGTSAIILAGTEEQKQKWLPPIATGKLQGAIVMSEPYIGSDMSNMETKAKLDGDVYIVNGKKRWITNAGAADIYLVYVRTSDRPEDVAQRKHCTALIIEKGMKGFSIEGVHELMGGDGFYHGVLDFNNVRVSVANRLGEEGEGWSIMLKNLGPERLLGYATTLGLMREALRYAVGYAQRRVQFGQPIINFNTNQFRIADMIMHYDVARLYTHYVAHLCDLGLDTPMHISSVKVFNTETFMRSFVLDAIQCMGGDGLTKDYPVERLMRDGKQMEIGGGTSDINRLLIFRQGLKNLAEDIKMPRRIMHKELNIPVPAKKGDKLPRYAQGEKGILEALAENYTVNPGLCMTIQELKDQIQTTDDELNKYLNNLEINRLANLYRGKKGVELVRATCEGLAKARPVEYYKYYPSWVRQEDMF